MIDRFKDIMHIVKDYEVYMLWCDYVRAWGGQIEERIKIPTLSTQQH